jgi:hypothetical protein
MQLVVVVHCTKGESLRDAVVARLSRARDPGLQVTEVQRKNRNPGWTKIHSTGDRSGAINVRWASSSSSLECRVVTRKSRKASGILGDFVTYLFNHHRSRINAVTVTSP